MNKPHRRRPREDGVPRRSGQLCGFRPSRPCTSLKSVPKCAAETTTTRRTLGRPLQSPYNKQTGLFVPLTAQNNILSPASLRTSPDAAHPTRQRGDRANTANATQETPTRSTVSLDESTSPQDALKLGAPVDTRRPRRLTQTPSGKHPAARLNAMPPAFSSTAFGGRTWCPGEFCQQEHGIRRWLRLI